MFKACFDPQEAKGYKGVENQDGEEKLGFGFLYFTGCRA